MCETSVINIIKFKFKFLILKSKSLIQKIQLCQKEY